MIESHFDCMCYGLQNLLQTPVAHCVAIVLELAFIEELISTLEIEVQILL